jgi:hypothetical protein
VPQHMLSPDAAGTGCITGASASTV